MNWQTESWAASVHAAARIEGESSVCGAGEWWMIEGFGREHYRWLDPWREQCEVSIESELPYWYFECQYTKARPLEMSRVLAGACIAGILSAAARLHPKVEERQQCRTSGSRKSSAACAKGTGGQITRARKRSHNVYVTSETLH